MKEWITEKDIKLAFSRTKFCAGKQKIDLDYFLSQSSSGAKADVLKEILKIALKDNQIVQFREFSSKDDDAIVYQKSGYITITDFWRDVDVSEIKSASDVSEWLLKIVTEMGSSLGW